MKFHRACLIEFTLALGMAAAQSAISPADEAAAGALPPVVYAENTIGGDAIKEEVAEELPVVPPAKPQSVVHFDESFNSETSADTIIAHVVASLAKDSTKACEIVKEAINVSKADAKLVARIVEAACLEVPDKMRIIAQCAVAASPEALSSVQLVLAKLDPGAGEDSSSGKDVSAVESRDEKGGKMVTTVPPVLYDPLRRAYLPPVPPVHVYVPPATKNSVYDYEDDDD